MNHVSYKAYKTSEVWYQDALEADLWHNDKGLLVNTAALNEREAFFDVTRVALEAAAASAAASTGQRM